MIVETDRGQKLTGFYRGQVLRHEKFGKCKIYIPGVYPEKCRENPDMVPDAEQATPIFGGSNLGSGVFSYPNIGATVWCFFANEDVNFPVFFATTQGGDGALSQYKDIRKDTSEEVVKSGEDALVHKIVSDKTTIKIWESGKIQIKVFDDRSYVTGNDIPDVGCCVDITNDGTIDINASTQLHITCPDIIFDSTSFTMNTQTLKFNVTSATEINTTTLKANVVSETDVTSPSETHCNNDSFNVISPVINLDGTQGSVAVKGKKHPPLFV